MCRKNLYWFVCVCFSFTSVLTKDELQELMSRASAFTKFEMNPCSWIYRNASQEYFDAISAEKQNIMEVYVKDNNGDPASPINGAIKGLFFSANVSRCGPSGELQPVPKSYFGRTRLLVPADVILAEMSNLYFSDFFCMYDAHYVTLVMTRPGSTADAFCQQFLIPVDLGHNPFLCLNMSTREAYVSAKIWVEILCTEDININHVLAIGGEFTDKVEYIPRTPRKGGIAKKPHCKVCNLYPRKFNSWMDIQLSKW